MAKMLLVQAPQDIDRASEPQLWRLVYSRGSKLEVEKALHVQLIFRNPCMDNLFVCVHVINIYVPSDS